MPGSVTYGFSLAVIGSVLGLESFLSYFELNSDSSRSTSITGATSALFAAGCAVGALLTTFLADRLGRMKTIQWTCVLCIVSSAVQGGSVHIAMFLVGRFFNGVGVGLMLALVPLYQCEIAPADVRGQMVSSHGLLIVTGHVSHGHPSPSVYKILICTCLNRPLPLGPATAATSHPTLPSNGALNCPPKPFLLFSS